MRDAGRGQRVYLATLAVAEKSDGVVRLGRLVALNDAVVDKVRRLRWDDGFKRRVSVADVE